MGLTTQNNELKFRLQAMEQQAKLRDGISVLTFVFCFSLVFFNFVFKHMDILFLDDGVNLGLLYKICLLRSCCICICELEIVYLTLHELSVQCEPRVETTCSQKWMPVRYAIVI